MNEKCTSKILQDVNGGSVNQAFLAKTARYSLQLIKSVQTPIRSYDPILETGTAREAGRVVNSYNCGTKERFCGVLSSCPDWLSEQYAKPLLWLEYRGKACTKSSCGTCSLYFLPSRLRMEVGEV